MAKKQKELTCTFFLGGKHIDRLTPEQLEKMAERLSKGMSLYYTAHPEEYERIGTARAR